MEAGLEKVVSSLDRVFAGLPKNPRADRPGGDRRAGIDAGPRLSRSWPTSWKTSEETERLCICLDTAHLFAGGHDISTEAGVKRTFAAFDRLIGRERLAALHLNDSKTALGSRVDRHDHIGKGQIGLEPFRFIMHQARFREVPKVLETPKGKEMKEDVENLALLRSLLA